MPLETKPWYQSKTMWISLLTIAAGVLAVFTDVYPGLKDVGTFAVLSGIVQMLLRVQTTTAIAGPDVSLEK